MTETESKDIDINTVNPEQNRMECQVIFGAILDGEIYEKHRDFFESYTFSNDLFNKLSETLREFYADNRAEDIKTFAQFFIDKYQADRSRVCVMLAEGMSSVKSLTTVEQYMNRLMKSKTPKGHTLGADENRYVSCSLA